VQDLTSGSLTGHLLRTTGFMLVSMIFQTLYVLVDLYWVGRLGTDAVAAVAISSNLMFVVLAATQMLGVGTTTLIAHAAGRKDRERAILVFNQAQILSLVVGAAFLLLTLATRNLYAASLSADDATRALAAEFLLWFIPGMSLQFGFVAMGAALRGTGNFRPGMIVQTWIVILNIILAPILIFGWGTGVAFGVAGAAMATFLSIAIGVIWMTLYFLPADSYLKFTPRDVKPRLSLWADMLKIGLPAGAEFGLMAVYLVLVYVVSRPFGAAAQAGFGIGIRIVQACFLPTVALGFAVAPVAGQNFGARQAHRVKQTFHAGARLAGGAMLAVAVIVWLFGEPLVRVFTADPAAVSVGTEYLNHRHQLRRIRRRVRHLEHVPGDGQYHSVAGVVGDPRHPRRRAGDAAVGYARFRPALDLVHLGGRRLRAAGDDAAAAQAGVQAAAQLRRGAGTGLIATPAAATPLAPIALRSGVLTIARRSRRLQADVVGLARIGALFVDDRSAGTRCQRPQWSATLDRYINLHVRPIFQSSGARPQGSPECASQNCSCSSRAWWD
jgi:putative MATE family efflux protein